LPFHPAPFPGFSSLWDSADSLVSPRQWRRGKFPGGRPRVLHRRIQGPRCSVVSARIPILWCVLAPHFAPQKARNKSFCAPKAGFCDEFLACQDNKFSFWFFLQDADLKLLDLRSESCTRPQGGCLSGRGVGGVVVFSSFICPSGVYYAPMRGNSMQAPGVAPI
jgi:hypothetical protein